MESLDNSIKLEPTPNDFDSWSDYDEYMASNFPDAQPVEDNYGDLAGKACLKIQLHCLTFIYH